MKTIIVLTFVAGMFAANPALAATSAADGLCGPGGPEGYKRPGGYCEMLGLSSLSSPSGRSAGGPPYGLPTDESEGPDGCVPVDGGGAALC